MTPTTSPLAQTLSLKSSSSLRTKTTEVNNWIIKARSSSHKTSTETLLTIRVLTCLSRKLEQGLTLTTRLLWEMSETPSLRQSVSSLSSNLRRDFNSSYMLRWTRMINSLSLWASPKELQKSVSRWTQLLTLSRRHLRFFREILISLTPPLVRMSWQTNSDKMQSAEEERLLLKSQVLKEMDKWVVNNRWTNLSRAINKISTGTLTLTWEWAVQLDLLAKDLQWAETHRWVETLRWEVAPQWVATLLWEVVFAQWDLLRVFLLVELDPQVSLPAQVHSSEIKTP